jgi:hypothetical protein
VPRFFTWSTEYVTHNSANIVSRLGPPYRFVSCRLTFCSYSNILYTVVFISGSVSTQYKCDYSHLILSYSGRGTYGDTWLTRSTLDKAVMLLTWRWETEFGSWDPAWLFLPLVPNNNNNRLWTWSAQHFWWQTYRITPNHKYI